MNKLLLNNKGRNHIKIFPLYKTDDIPSDEGDKIRWCEAKYNELLYSAIAKRLYLYKNVKSGVLIAVWELDGLYYLIQSIRNEFKTYNSIIYINKEKDDSLNIAKFLRSNFTSIMNDYREQIIEARNWLLEKSDGKI